MSKDNKTFFVSVPEVHYSHYKVYAKNADDARQKVADDTGGAELIDTVFSHLFSDRPNDWGCEDRDGNDMCSDEGENKE